MAIIARDSFNRSDSSSAIGTADLGGTWTVPMPSPGNSPWGISSNKAYCVSPSTATFTTLAGVPKNIALLGSSPDAHTVQADITLSATSPNVGLVAKFVDTSNFIITALRNTTSHGFSVIICVAGTFTVLHDNTTFPSTKGATYKVKLFVDATSWELFIDGVSRASGSLTGPQAAALAGTSYGGLFLASGVFNGVSPNDPGDSRFDNYRFGVPDATSGWSVGFLKF